jgi:alkanesulfonate monooxygenase
MEEWLLTDAADGFNVMFPYLPAGLDDFVNSVVPELQKRGIFRREYEGKTLRENLGLPRPLNQFFNADQKPGENKVSSEASLTKSKSISG